MNEVVGTRHFAQELHFDVTPTLKFFLYLNDINRDNGAFWCVPGSHHDVAKIRKQHENEISYEDRQFTRHPDRDGEAVPIEAPAGSLIVFSTEVLNRPKCFIERGSASLVNVESCEDIHGRKGTL